MSVSSTSSRSSVSWSETKSSEGSSVYLTVNSEKSVSDFRPYDDNVEPLASKASAEEIAK